jgi:hypothetical protein
MLLLLWMALPALISAKEVWYNMATQGPFRPTTAVTYLVECPNFALGTETLSDFSLTGWPETMLITNTGTNACYFNVQTQVEFDDWSPSAGMYLFAGQSMLYTVSSPASDANQDSSADPLVAYTFGVGATTIAITGGLTQ